MTGHRARAKDLILIAEFIEVGELGLALEQMADVLNEWDFAVLDDERADLLALADRMNISIRRVLEFCPTLIAWRPSAFRPGHIPSYRSMCKRPAQSPVADARHCLLLLLSPLLSAAVGRKDARS